MLQGKEREELEIKKATNHKRTNERQRIQTSLVQSSAEVFPIPVASLKFLSDRGKWPPQTT